MHLFKTVFVACAASAVAAIIPPPGPDGTYTLRNEGIKAKVGRGFIMFQIRLKTFEEFPPKAC